MTLFAAEPDVLQPIACCTDARGRLWVVENLTYSDAKTNYDLQLNDRVSVFEDEDGDGKFDRKTIFWEGGQKVTGIEIGLGGVWLTAAPNLVFIPDANRDDVPDGEPEYLLDGFEGDVIRHNIVNGLRWGPDGWLYGRHGIQATSFVGKPGSPNWQRIPINCSIWRFHPRTHKFEIVAQGGTNPWGFDYDRHGEMFMINTVIGHLFHIVPNALYRRMYGHHFNPHSYQVIEQTADHIHWAHDEEHWRAGREEVLSRGTDEAGGGHAHTGLMIYQGGNWPEKYHNSLFTANFHGRRLNNDTIERRGNSYVGLHAADFMKTDDPWFRGVELVYGPGGGVYLLDWSDIGECHENDGIHRSSGRIFKITYGEPAPHQGTDLCQLNNADLLDLLTNRNEWYSRKSRRILQQRAMNSELTEVARELKNRLAQATNEVHALRYLWALYSINGANSKTLLECSHHQNEHVRAWAIRLLGDGMVSPGTEVVERFVEMARNDDSGLVRMYLASSLPRFPAQAVFQIAYPLVLHESDAGDRVQPKLIWYGIEPFVAEGGRPDATGVGVDDWLKLASDSRIPLVRENIARKYTSQIKTNPGAVRSVIQLAMEVSDPLSIELLDGMSAAVEGWSKAPQPENWIEFSQRMNDRRNDEINLRLRELGVVFGDGRSISQVKEIMLDESASVPARRKAVEIWSAEKPSQLFSTLSQLLRNKSLSNQVARSMVHCDEPQVAKVLLNWFNNMDPEGQSIVVDTLTRRVEWSKELLNAVDRQRLPKSNVSAYHAAAMHQFNDPELTKLINRVWGVVTATPEEKKKLIQDWTRKLETAVNETRLASAGRTVFKERCSACHQMFGVGGTTGPDLTGSDRKNLHYLLSNILAPSSSVADHYRSTIFQLDDGRLVSGLVIEQSAQTYRVQLPTEVVTIDRDSIESVRRSDQSVMPDGLFNDLEDVQIRALIAYLNSDRQVPFQEN